MLIEEPKWTFSNKTTPPPDWHGPVDLLPQHVLGKWFCLERTTGSLLWHRSILRANCFRGIDSGVIVASENIQDGPENYGCFGCYGISLCDGKAIWASHEEGFYGRVLRLLDAVPGFTNEFRDSPVHVIDGKVFCRTGRILSVLTGKLIDRWTSNQVAALAKPMTPTQQMENAIRDCKYHKYERVAVGNLVWLTANFSSHDPLSLADWEIVAEGERRQAIWRFQLKGVNQSVSLQLAPPFLYLLIAEERYLPKVTMTHSRVVVHEFNPTLWRVVVVDIYTGHTLQDFPLSSAKLKCCAICDLDEAGMLIASVDGTLFYFSKQV